MVAQSITREGTTEPYFFQGCGVFYIARGWLFPLMAQIYVLGTIKQETGNQQCPNIFTIPEYRSVVESLAKRFLCAAEMPEEWFKLVPGLIKQVLLLSEAPTVRGAVEMLLVRVNDADTLARQYEWKI